MGFFGTGGVLLRFAADLKTSPLSSERIAKLRVDASRSGTLTSIQSGSWLGVKGFDGLLEFGTEFGEGAFTVDRAGSPDEVLAHRNHRGLLGYLTAIQPPFSPIRTGGR